MWRYKSRLRLPSTDHYKVRFNGIFPNLMVLKFLFNPFSFDVLNNWL